jgi:hypothetical protein
MIVLGKLREIPGMRGLKPTVSSEAGGKGICCFFDFSSGFSPERAYRD